MDETSGQTIQRALSGYDLGGKLRQLRLKKKIGLVDLGKHTGLSPSMLSQLENGKLVPTLPTLARIGMVFDVGVDYFFSDARRHGSIAVVRASERMKFPERADAPNPAYQFEVLAFSTQEKTMQAYLAEFPAREWAQVNDHVHDGAEFIHVQSGALAIRYVDKEIELGGGDSVYFDAAQPHGYRGLSLDGTRAIVITTPTRL
jgi:transcriptional regulator with XRE-family HTH domain